MMRIDLENPRHQILLRDTVFASLAAIIIMIPAVVSLGIAAWALIGSLLAIAAVHPRSLIFAVPLMIPLSFQPVQVGNLQFNMLEILIIAAVLGYAPRVLAGAWQLRGIERDQRHILMRRVVPDRLAAGISLLLMVGGVIAVLFMADGAHSAESLRTFRWTMFFPVAYFLLAAPVLYQREEFRALAGALFLAGATVSAAIAVADGFLGGGVQADAVTRLSGIAPHPNALALVLDRAVVFGLLVGILFREHISRHWMLPSLAVSGVLLMTFSRGAVLGLVAGVLIVLLLTRARRMAVAVAGASITGTIGLILMAPDRTLSLLGGGSGSLRLELWQSSVRMISDHPITGVGPDQFLYQYLPRYVTPEAWPERFTSHPHNLLLDSWLSVGIIGIVVVALIGLLLVRNIRGALQTRDRISLAAAGGIITVGVHGMVDQSYFLPELATSFWLLIILLIPAAASAEPEISREREQSEGQD
jgi:putative inorganic carbon (hco3(-)) transporter